MVDWIVGECENVPSTVILMFIKIQKELLKSIGMVKNGRWWIIFLVLKIDIVSNKQKMKLKW